MLFSDYYKQCKKISKILDDDVFNRQYKFILCLLIKTICIKADRRVSNKVDELIKFSINELNCLMINELYLLCLFLNDNPLVKKKTFAKFHTSIKGGLENAVKNTAWDIYHARLIEQEMKLYNSEDNTIELPYFATNDQGVWDYFIVNPRKMVVIDEGIATNVYAHNVGDMESMLLNHEIYDQIVDVKEIQKRKENVKNVPVDDILNKLLIDLKSVKI